MKKLDQIIDDLKKEMNHIGFSETIREARGRLGLMQYRTAQHLNMTISRLKNLETGYFRVIPKATEIRDLCEFYELPEDEMIKKAEIHVIQRKLSRAING